MLCGCLALGHPRDNRAENAAERIGHRARCRWRRAADRPGGLLVTAVVAGSPGARAGIRTGDVLRTIDGKEVANGGQLRYALATEGVGKTLDVRLWRDQAERSVAVTLAPPPETPARSITKVTARAILNGVTVANLSPAYAQELGAGLPEQGVVVVAVDASAPAARFLKPGALIEAVGGQPVASVADVVRLSQGGALLVRFAIGEQRAECGVNNAGGLSCRS